MSDQPVMTLQITYDEYVRQRDALTMYATWHEFQSTNGGHNVHMRALFESRAKEARTQLQAMPNWSPTPV